MCLTYLCVYVCIHIYIYIYTSSVYTQYASKASPEGCRIVRMLVRVSIVKLVIDNIHNSYIVDIVKCVYVMYSE